MVNKDFREAGAVRDHYGDLIAVSVSPDGDVLIVITLEDEDEPQSLSAVLAPAARDELRELLDRTAMAGVRVKHGPGCGCTPCKAEPGYQAQGRLGTGTTLEFTSGRRIVAHDEAGSAQVGRFAAEVAGDPGVTEWTAFLWRYADTEAEYGRLDGKMAGLRFATTEAELQRRVCLRLSEGGPWWTAKAGS